MTPAAVSVGIPTHGRGARIAETLQRIAACDPPPAEVTAFIDQAEGDLAARLAVDFPDIRVLSSTTRVGPGGARHRCLQVARQPFFVSFDDDSWPLDRDFFAEVIHLFARHPRRAILAASIYFPNETMPERSSEERIVADYTGCGYAIRVDAYRETAGHIDRACPYGIEEVDLAIQLHALDWGIVQCGSLRVFHDTELSHHSRADVVAGTVQNVALRAFLRYPPSLWPRAVLQLGNVVFDAIRRGRFSGLLGGLCGISSTLRQYADQRRELPAAKIRSYLDSRSRLT